MALIDPGPGKRVSRCWSQGIMHRLLFNRNEDSGTDEKLERELHLFFRFINAGSDNSDSLSTDELEYFYHTGRIISMATRKFLNRTNGSCQFGATKLTRSENLDRNSCWTDSTNSGFIMISVRRDSKYSIWNTLFGILYCGILVIWNT